jgi:hypothetical protein
MRFLLASLVAVATFVGPDEPTLIWGVGTFGCLEVTEQLVSTQGYGQSKLSVAVFSWVQGYISALNLVGLGQNGHFADLNSIPEEEQWSHIVQFCQENPDGFVIDAAREMAAMGVSRGGSSAAQAR